MKSTATPRHRAAAKQAADNYFIELGRLMHGYARIESAIHVLFRHCLGLGDIGRALSGGQNLARVINMTRQIARARNLDTIEGIESIFSHINAIGILRDSLVHRGAEIFGDEMISTNIVTAQTVEAAKLLRINIIDIKDATRDCQTAFLRIAAIINPDSANLAEKEARKELARAWSYKPLQQETPYRPPRTDAKSRQRQPKTSQE